MINITTGDCLNLLDSYILQLPYEHMSSDSVLELVMIGGHESLHATPSNKITKLTIRNSTPEEEVKVSSQNIKVDVMEPLDEMMNPVCEPYPLEAFME